MNINAGILTILLSLPVFLFGQDWSQVDSVAFDALSERAEDAAFDNPALAYATFDTLIDLSKKADFPYAFLYSLARKAQAAVYFHDFEAAEEFLNNAKPHFENYEGKLDGSDSYIQPMLNTTQLYYLNDLGQDEKVISLSSLLIKKIENGFGGDYREYHLIPTIMYKAVALKKTGRLEEAQATLLDGVDLAIKLDDADLRHFYKHLGDIHRLKGELTEAREFYQKALRENLAAYHQNPSNRLASRVVSIYSAIAELYEDSDPDSSKHYLDQADPFLARDSFLLIEHTLLKVDLSIKTDQIQQANTQLNGLLRLMIVNSDGPDPKYSRVLLYEARVLKHQNQFEKALEKIQLAISKNSSKYSDSEESGGPDDFIDRKLASQLLLQKSQIAMLLGRLDIADAAVRQAMDILLHFKSSILTEDDRSFLLANSKPIFEQALKLGLQHQLEGTDAVIKPMYVMENAKAINLLGAMRLQVSGPSDILPKKLVSDERKIREKLESLQNSIVQKTDLTNDDPDVVEMRTLRSSHQDILAQMADLQRVEKLIDRYDVAKDIDSEVRATLLARNRSMIHYYSGEKDLYLLHTSKNDQELFRIENTAIVNQWIELVRGEETTGTLTETGSSALADLFQLLIGPIKDGLVDELIVVPDGQLFYLPFEMLISDAEGNEGSPHYLVQDCELSYTYSASVLAEQKKKTRKNASKSVLAFAPEFQSPSADGFVLDRGSFASLPFSKIEVRNIENHFSVTSYVGAAASEPTFLEHAGKHSILHLATHAAAIDNPSSRSYLAFSGSSPNLDTGLLFLSELTQLPLQAELVTLSACETGLGKLHGGEGVISLARGFQYAGAGALLTSLWKVNDEMTANLMEFFYKHLADGKSKSKSLQLAKIEMLSATNLSNRNPLYWAGFVIIGDPSPISYLSSRIHWSFFPIVISMIIAIMLIWRRSDKRHQKVQ